MDNDFTSRLSAELEKQRKSKFSEAYDAIHGIAEGIHDVLTDGKVGCLDVELEPENIAFSGSNFHIHIRIPGTTHDIVFLRAYISLGGFPISLDLRELDAVSCNNKQELENAVLRFIKKPEVANQIFSLYKYVHSGKNNK